MQTFDYQCVACGFSFTFLHREDREYPPCPTCKAKVKRLITAARAINYNGPWSPRFRRGLTGQKPSPNLPTFCAEDCR